MTILVTGAAGYLGNQTVKRLVADGRSVRALVRNRAKAAIRLKEVAHSIEIVEGDVTEPNSLTAAMKDVDSVIHYVAIAMEKGGQTYESVNYQGTVNLLKAAQTARVQRFINMSQNGASQRPAISLPRQQGQGARSRRRLRFELDGAASLGDLWTAGRILQYLRALAQSDTARISLDWRRGWRSFSRFRYLTWSKR